MELFVPTLQRSLPHPPALTECHYWIQVWSARLGRWTSRFKNKILPYFRIFQPELFLCMYPVSRSNYTRGRNISVYPRRTGKNRCLSRTHLDRHDNYTKKQQLCIVTYSTIYSIYPSSLLQRTCSPFALLEYIDFQTKSDPRLLWWSWCPSTAPVPGWGRCWADHKREYTILV